MSNPANWKVILGDFGEVLEQEVKFGIWIPESKLPYPRETIKRAIMQALNEAANQNPVLKAHMEIAYLNLSNFVPESDAQSMRQAELLVKQLADMKQADTAKLKAIRKSSKEVAAHFEKVGEIHNRMIRLSGQYLQGLKSTGKFQWTQSI